MRSVVVVVVVVVVHVHVLVLVLVLYLFLSFLPSFLSLFPYRPIHFA